MKQFVRACPTVGDCIEDLILAFPRLSIGKKSKPVYLMVQRYCSSSKMKISSGECQNSKKCLDIIQRRCQELSWKNTSKELNRNCPETIGERQCARLQHEHQGAFSALPLDNFQENLGVSDEQGERFHQDLNIIYRNGIGVDGMHNTPDYHWSINRDCPQIKHSRKSYKRKFLS